MVDQTSLLVLARAAGLIARAPGFSHPSVPPMVRAGFALALAVAVAPSVRHAPVLSFTAFTLALAGDFTIGAAIGFGASLLYDGAYFAGRTIDDYIGVRGSVPGADVTSAQGFGRLWSSVFLTAFVLLDGWVPVVHAFAGSFAHAGAAAPVDDRGWMRLATSLPATMLRAALLVAAPPIAVAASLHVALAAIARVVPRLSSFTLSFPVIFAAVLLLTVVTVPLIAPAGARPWLVLPW